ncbi:ABC transporter ATP-binding protein/permease [Paenibacillus sp. p3-SID867]|uniref:ABC transporter ATP-binding protein n=1 Tax=Paenibacillus sp. p3-SID867 TaxID=2916363 RepID=UPI0021A929F7|nr:ABC transporter ATP-binding protein [Paenibacillus sp. p3-SID867]MCT1403818.1 ABC transporter ATP-binding protein/permease [Paenibacillus sp. p3-SID867]
MASFFPAMQIWLQKELINSISQISTSHIFFQKAIQFAIIIVVASVIVTIFTELAKIIYQKIKIKMQYKLKKKLLQKSGSLSLIQFEDSRIYDQLGIADEGLNKNVMDVINSLLLIVQQISSLIVVYGLLSSISWYIPLVLIAASIPGMIFLIISKNQQFKITLFTLPQGREAEYLARLITRREAAKEIRIFNLSGYLIDQWSRIILAINPLFIRQAIKESRNRVLGATILQASMLLISLVLIFSMDRGHLTIGDYVALIAAVATVQGIFGIISMHVGLIYEMSMYVNKLFDFFDINIDDNISAENESVKDDMNFDKIQVDNITFRFPDREEKILDKVSLTINKGETIAIVGKNGAGKSTLVNCILGLYKTEGGQIFYGDTPLSEIPLLKLHQMITVVFQDFVKYQMTFKQNIALGNIEHLDNESNIISISEQVGISGLVNSLENGINTRIGKEFGGTELSGGQWQKLAIARAMARSAEILILDEPTASLDPLSELEVFDHFRDLSKGKTTLIIAHRLGPVRHADRILVMDNGQIIESGTHDELIDVNGEYAKMYNSQAKWYSTNTNNENEKQLSAF